MSKMFEKKKDGRKDRCHFPNCDGSGHTNCQRNRHKIEENCPLAEAFRLEAAKKKVNCEETICLLICGLDTHSKLFV